MMPTTNMNHLIHIVGEELHDWEDPVAANRYSIFTQNLMLANKISKHEHLTPRTSTLCNELSTSPVARETTPTSIEDAVAVEAPVTGRLEDSSRMTSNPANIGRPRTRSRPARQSSTSSSGDWTWRPSVPHRTSSMSTRRRRGNGQRRPDLATFHRRSCQLFSSLDSTLSNAVSTNSDTSRTSTSTSPSLASSVTTQATSILDDNWAPAPVFSSFHLELNPNLTHNGRQTPDFGDFLGNASHSPRLGSRRSSSQLSPNITSTEQVFWTSDATRKLEYAKIDAAHTGFKGFVKRLVPRSWRWAHGKRRQLHQTPVATTTPARRDADQDSVRRFRISIASETQEAINLAESQAASRAGTPAHMDPGRKSIDVRLDLETGHVSNKHLKAPIVTKALAKVRSSNDLFKMFSKPSDKAKRRSTQF